MYDGELNLFKFLKDLMCCDAEIITCLLFNSYLLFLLIIIDKYKDILNHF